MAANDLLPRQPSTEQKTQRFNQGILISFSAHACLVIGFVIQVTFFSDPVFDLSQAVRVDMVALPDKLNANEMPQKVQDILKEKPVEEPKKVEAKPEPEDIKKEQKADLPKKEIKSEAEAINLKKAKTTQKTALEKLKAMSAIEKLRQEVESEAVPKKPVVIKGRVLSAGSALTGLDKLQSDNYLQNLDSHIKQYWALPQWLANKSFKTRILVKFDANGTVLSKQIIQPSGQPAYDDYCLLAIDQASPFPKFIEKFSEKYSKDGVVVGFPE